MKRRIAMTCGTLVLAGSLVACMGSTQPAGPAGQPTQVGAGGQPAPSWVNKGSGAFSGGPHGKAFYGVGLATGIRNPALLRQTVDNRARAEIAKIFDLYVAAMMKDYQRSTTAGNFKSSAEEQDVVSAQKTVTEATVRGIEIRDHWVDARGTHYALAVLPFNQVIKNSGGLPARIRDHVRKNARRAFEDLDKELKKRTARNDPAPAPTTKPDPQPQPTPQPDPQPQPTAKPDPTPAPAAKPKAKLRVGLKIQGRNSKRIQTCFAAAITDAGYDLFEVTNNVDVMVKGKLRYKRGGVNNGMRMVKADLDVRVIDMASGKTLAADAPKLNIGRPTVNQALITISAKFCQGVVPSVIKKIKAKFHQ
jgi:hypothetical protein